MGPESLRLTSVAFTALQLRDAVSKFSRVETNAAICQELKVHSANYSLTLVPFL